MTSTNASADQAVAAPRGRPRRSLRAERLLDVVIRSIVPVLLALVAGGVLLAALGRDPITFYKNIWIGGVQGSAWQDSAIRMAPFLLIAAGLVLIFRANIWNLGYNGQFLLAAAVVSGLAPQLVSEVPLWLAFVDPVPGRRRGRRSLDARAGRPEGEVRHERDHYDADDVVHRH